MGNQKHYGIGHIKRLKSRFKEGKTTKEEILELLLSYVIKGKDVKSQSKEIYKKSGGKFRKIPATLSNEKIQGIGEESQLFFLILQEYVSQQLKEPMYEQKCSVKNQQDVINYFRNLLGGSDKEEVHVLFMDAKNNIFSDMKAGEGTITQSLLYPREIIKEALKKGALSIIVVHNHPSGDPAPSTADKKITKKLMFAAKEMDIAVLDHIIVGNKGYYSFFEEGLIESYSGSYKYLMESI